MVQDTVLIGAFAFFAIGGAIWLILSRVQVSDLPDRVKRLITYGLLGLVAAVAIYVINWHSQAYKDKYTKTSALSPPVISQLG